MQSIEDYTLKSGVSRRTVYNHRGSKITLIKAGKKAYVAGAGIEADPKAVAQITTAKKKVFNSRIEFARKRIQQTDDEAEIRDIRTALIDNIADEVRALESAGIKINGYNAKSIYRKLKTGKTQRQPRSDKFTIRNSILQEDGLREDIFSLALGLYEKAARANFSIITDLIIEFARNNEDYWELAAVPRSTLYNFFRRDLKLMGYDSLHKYLNHYNLYYKDLPKVIGAFTDEIGFMDYIIGDDHKNDVAGVWIWDEVMKRYIKKQVKIWLWIEGKTMMPLGWTIKVGDFTAADLKTSLAEVFTQWGLPSKAIMIDNGIGRADEFRQFCFRCGVDVTFSKPYTPTNKATVERSFGLVKNEFDVFFQNFVGPNKETEARHSGNSLSPEESGVLFSEYKKKLESFLTGFFITRDRTRVLNGKKIRTSIRDYFDAFYATREKISISQRELIYAFDETVVKVFKGSIRFKGTEFVAKEAIPLSYMNKEMRIMYNPLDLSAIECYAEKALIDSDTGEIKEAGKRLFTLYNIRSDVNKRETVNQLNKDLEKTYSKAAKALREKMELKSESVERAMSDRVTPTGEVLNVRKRVEAQLKDSLRADGEVKVNHIAMRTEAEELTGEAEGLTFEETEEREDYSLTINEE